MEVLLKYGCRYGLLFQIESHRTDQIWDGYSAVFTAVAYKQYETLECNVNRVTFNTIVLLKYGLSPEQTAPGKSTPLYEAAILGDVKSAESKHRIHLNKNVSIVEIRCKWKLEIQRYEVLPRTLSNEAHYTPFWKACFEG